jgi:hypothetical protein
MFGSNRRLERRLREQGRRARAEILEASQTRMAITTGNDAIVSNTEIVWKLRLRVMPDGEPPFEVALKERFMQLEQPHAGQVLSVLYDPDDHDKIAIDHDPEAQIDAAIDGALGSSAAVAANPGLAGPLTDLMQAALRDPQGFSEQMRQQGAAAFGLQGMPGVVAGVGGKPAAEDPLARLEKLADLHARGVLTDEEFAEQKRKILAE